MSQISICRLQHELRQMMEEDISIQGQIRMEMSNDNWKKLRAAIAGPPDTPYQGGWFHLEIKIPENYPFSPPMVRFITRIWHPNISLSSGAICGGIIKDEWTAAVTLRPVLLSLQTLLATGNPNDPQNKSAASQFMRNPRLFNMTAEHWTRVYAGGPRSCPLLDSKISQLKLLGFDEHKARRKLSKENWNVEKTAQYLLLKSL